jgi:hypothetical protein
MYNGSLMLRTRLIAKMGLRKYRVNGLMHHIISPKTEKMLHLRF